MLYTSRGHPGHCYVMFFFWKYSPRWWPTQIFLEFSPRSLGFHNPIWLALIFSRWFGEKPPTSPREAVGLLHPFGAMKKDHLGCWTQACNIHESRKAQLVGREAAFFGWMNSGEKTTWDAGETLKIHGISTCWIFFHQQWLGSTPPTQHASVTNKGLVRDSKPFYCNPGGVC